MSKILVAEDELAINKMICMNLNITGYQTVSMQDGQEVLDYLAAGQSADLAIVDIMMPKVDGFALLEPLNKAGIPVIYLTALGDIESKVRGLSGGAEDYMVKPFEMLELLLRIEKILKRTGKSAQFQRKMSRYLLHRWNMICFAYWQKTETLRLDVIRSCMRYGELVLKGRQELSMCMWRHSAERPDFT